MMIHYDDTIAAISTPPGKGGIGIVRVSGHDALKIASKIFILKSAEDGIEPGRMYFGRVVDDHGMFLDHGYLVFFRSSASFTGEDSVEISGHGSPLVLKSILEAAVHAGARIAEPGEFAMRAFLNGRVDLIQAEAIKDLVDARTSFQARIAYNQVEGELSKKLYPVKDKLLDIIAGAEASLDFPEEEERFFSHRELANEVTSVLLNIKRLVDGYKDGRVIKEGATVAIIGSPNVGKSSIFNQLLEYDRAIVTDIPGTTRDTVEEVLDIGGIPVRLIDTAGLKEARDFIEKEGVKRSKDAIKKADIIVYVLDNSRHIMKSELLFFKDLSPHKTILVINKTDLDFKKNSTKMEEIPAKFKNLILISAKTGAGIPELNGLLRKALSSVSVEEVGEALVTNIRQGELLKKSLKALEKATQSIRREVSEEFFLIDLKKALSFLGEMTGEVSSEELYDRIFSKFCLGK